MRLLLPLALTATAVSAGHVVVPVARKPFSHPSVPHSKRADDETIDLKALNNITGGGYYSEFSIGTPAQNLSFLLDTGSSDTWVNSVDADLCNSETQQLTQGFCQKQFDPEKSDSFKEVIRNGFDIQYLDGREISGDYFNDTVTIGDLKIENQQLGLALNSSRPTGIMGLGFSSNVAARKEYKTIIDNMLDQGHIDARAFSLYLNDLDSDSGTILFGGIDQKKFIGSLAKLPLLPETTLGSVANANITSYNVKISGFDLKKPSSDNEDLDLPSLDANAILDSGSTITLLPDGIVGELYTKFNVLQAQDVNVPFVDCAYAGDKGDGYVFEFKFNGKTIQVPMAEMVINSFADVQSALMSISQFDGWEGVCMFGIADTGQFGVNTDSFTLLGATFLRSAYVVYDLENKQLGLAQANLNATDSDIVEISSSDDLPDVKGVSSQEANNDSSDDEDAAGMLTPSIMAITSMMGVGALILAL